MQPIEIHRRYFDLKVMLVLVFVIITIFTATRSRAQDNTRNHRYFSMGIQGLGAVSLGDFFYESDQLVAWGIQSSLLYHPKKLNKCYLGVGFTYCNYGFEKYKQEVEIDGLWYDLNTLRNYNIYFPSLNVRIMPWDDQRIVPVFDAFIGPRAFSTVSTYSYEKDPGFLLRFLGAESEEKVVRNIESKDWTWGYGFSVGMNYLINPALELELTLHYTDGHEVNYLTRKDIKKDPSTGATTYLPRRSDTDMLSLAFGIRINPF
jgi:hypothetical protein